MALQLGSLGHPAFRIVHTLAPARAMELIPVGRGTARPEHTQAEDHVAASRAGCALRGCALRCS